MNKTGILSAGIVSLFSTVAMAGNPRPSLGTEVPALGIEVPALSAPNPALGDIVPAMGADLSLPTLAGIAAISLVAGIRYIRNKRS